MSLLRRLIRYNFALPLGNIGDPHAFEKKGVLPLVSDFLILHAMSRND
jgi:hypothetical protein